jgi:hypothetical protein
MAAHYFTYYSALRDSIPRLSGSDCPWQSPTTNSRLQHTVTCLANRWPCSTLYCATSFNNRLSLAVCRPQLTRTNVQDSRVNSVCYSRQFITIVLLYSNDDKLHYCGNVRPVLKVARNMRWVFWKDLIYMHKFQNTECFLPTSETLMLAYTCIWQLSCGECNFMLRNHEADTSERAQNTSSVHNVPSINTHLGCIFTVWHTLAEDTDVGLIENKIHLSVQYDSQCD